MVQTILAFLLTLVCSSRGMCRSSKSKGLAITPSTLAASPNRSSIFGSSGVEVMIRMGKMRADHLDGLDELEPVPVRHLDVAEDDVVGA